MRRMSDTEYSALREENTARIQTIASLDNSVLVSTGSLWLVVLAINENILHLNSAILSSALQLGLLAIAGLIILIAAIKNWENVFQITVLSSYVKVFYEYPSKTNRVSNDNGLYFWEHIQMKTNSFNSDDKHSPFKHLKLHKNKLLYKVLYNGSYIVLELSTFMLFFVCLLTSGFHKGIIILISVVSCILIVFIACVIVKLVFVNGFSKEKQKAILKLHVEAAINLGVIDVGVVTDDSKMNTIQTIVEDILDNG